MGDEKLGENTYTTNIFSKSRITSKKQCTCVGLVTSNTSAMRLWNKVDMSPHMLLQVTVIRK